VMEGCSGQQVVREWWWM